MLANSARYRWRRKRTAGSQAGVPGRSHAVGPTTVTAVISRLWAPLPLSLSP